MRWNGETVCILASGPSLTKEDAKFARFNAQRVVTVNESWKMCPAGWPCDVLYGADSNWWLHAGPSPSRQPHAARECWTQDHQWNSPPPPWLHVIPSRAGIGMPGEEDGKPYIYTGSNSSFQAMGLAVLWGARRIVFLGLDLKVGGNGQNHWHADYVAPVRNVTGSYKIFRDAFNKAAPMLAERGVTVLNASRDTALECFPRVSLAEALSQ